MKNILYYSLFLIVVILALFVLYYISFDITACDSHERTYGVITQIAQLGVALFAMLGLFNALLFLGACMIEDNASDSAQSGSPKVV